MYKQLLEVIFTPESMVTYRHEMHCQITQAETHLTIVFAHSSPRKFRNRYTLTIGSCIEPPEQLPYYDYPVITDSKCTALLSFAWLETSPP